MKILLITNYWYPWNTSGTFRWLHLSKYIDFDVLTSKKPNKGFYDETLPSGKYNRLYHYGHNIPAFLSGIYLSIIAVFIRADKYIYTCPPETLLFGAWINQKLGRKVYVDMRDKIDRDTQPHRWSIPIYQWFYKRIKNICVCMRFFDPEKTVIRHGYDVTDRFYHGVKKLLNNKYLKYSEYCCALIDGYGRDYWHPKYYNYNSSSVVTLRHLGNPIKGQENLNPECFRFKPESWKQISIEMKKFLQLY